MKNVMKTQPCNSISRRSFLNIVAVGGLSVWATKTLGHEGINYKNNKRINLWYSASDDAANSIKRASTFGGVDGLIVEYVPNPQQPGRSWASLLDDLYLADEYPKVTKRGQARENVLKLRDNINTLTEQAKAANIKLYAMGAELSLPDGMLQAYPETGDLNTSALYYYMEQRLDKIFSSLPNLSGVCIYLDEPLTSLIYNLNGPAYSERIKRLIETMLNPCRRHDRQLIMCTFTNFYPERLRAFQAALKQIPADKHLWVNNYCCPGDWGLYPVRNPLLGDIGPHPEIVCFDHCGENWGQSTIPFFQLDHYVSVLRDQQKKGSCLKGIAGYVSWNTGSLQSVFGRPNEINAWAAPYVIANPELDTRVLYLKYLTERFNAAAAQALVKAYSRSFEVVMKSYQLLGFWAVEYPKSHLPSPQWIESSLHTESLAIWDENWRATERGLIKPDETVVEKVIAEKNAAEQMALLSLNEIGQARNLLEASDYQMLHKHFSLGYAMARVLKPYMEAFIRFKLMDRAGNSSQRQRIEALLAELEGMTQIFEEEHRWEPFDQADRIRKYVKEMRCLLDGKPLDRKDRVIE